MNVTTIHAPAKVNLGLDVLSRRDDGYHEISMILQSISLFDVITLTETQTEGIHLKMKGSDVPADSSNLAYRAAALFLTAHPISGGISIEVEKHIPVAAGLAGGSTDRKSTRLNSSH